MAINYHEKCPAVAQPGRAFGCRYRPMRYADHEKQPIGHTSCGNRRVAGSNKNG